MFQDLLNTLLVFTNWQILLALLVGGIVGTVFSAIPGLSGTLALALILPFTYGLDTQVAFVAMIGMLGGTVYGGSLTAITLNIPGAPGSVCTTFDGHPMYKKGLGEKAIGIATFSSVIGGLFSAVLLTIAAPQLANLALKFGPPEYFTLALMGIVAVISMGDNHVKGVISALFGLLIGTIGIDLYSTVRFDFGISALVVGVPMIPVVVGLFAFSLIISVINSVQNEIDEIKTTKFKRMRFPNLKEIRRLSPALTRGSVIGSFIGFLPGAGASISAFVSYTVEKKFSKNKEQFGKGAPEGIASVESANNATTGGILIPTITLGIPGDQFTAILLGAFLIHGLPVGPLLFRDNQDLIYIIFITVFLMNIVYLAVGYFGAKYIVRLAGLRKSILMPFIAICGLIGSYAAELSHIHIAYCLIFGIIGFFFNKYKIDIAPLLLGLILSGLLENSFVQSLTISQGDYSIFLQRPISFLFVLISCVFIITSVFNINVLFDKLLKYLK